MKKVTSLRVSADSEVGLKTVDKIISNIKTIVSLHLDLRTFHLDPKKDSSVVPQKLFSTAMSAAMRVNLRAWKMSLTHLALWNVDLRPPSCAIWVKALDLALLQVIELSHCPRVGNFVAAMSNDTRNPELQSLTINYHVPSAAEGHHLCDVLENYFEKESPLSELVLRIKGLPRLPNWMRVASHALQFETLLLDMDGPNAYSGADVENILGCTSDNLRQFGFVADENTDIATIFGLTNPVTLYLIGSSQQVTNVFDKADQGFEVKKDPDGLPLRLRVVASGSGDYMTCFMRSEMVLFRKKIWTASHVDLRDLAKYAEEVDVLMGEPMVFGPDGRY